MKLLELQPLLKRIRWGGRRLGTLLNKPIGNESDYAESWEIADHGDDQSLVIGGEYEGWTLNRLVRERGRELLGRHAPLEQFPLLVKFLDATDRLSLQVHPDDRQAKEFDPTENGKTEAWVIVAAEPGSRLYAGLRDGVTAGELKQSLEAGEPDECLHSFTVSPGDCVFVPAGTVHALGEGIVLADFQQQSDLTFRLHDWGRLGQDGKPREMHLPQGIACTDFQRGPVNPVEPTSVAEGACHLEELVHSDYFVIRRHTASQPFTITSDDRFHVWMTLDGRGGVTSGDRSVPLQPGKTLLQPASGPGLEFRPDGSLVLLEAFLP